MMHSRLLFGLFLVIYWSCNVLVVYNIATAIISD